MADKTKSMHEHILDIKIQDSASDKAGAVFGGVRAHFDKLLETFSVKDQAKAPLSLKGIPPKQIIQQSGAMLGTATPEIKQVKGSLAGGAVAIMPVKLMEIDPSIFKDNKFAQFMGGEKPAEGGAKEAEKQGRGFIQNLVLFKVFFLDMIKSVLSLPGKIVKLMGSLIAKAFQPIKATFKFLTTGMSKMLKKFGKSIVKTVLWPFRTVVNGIKDEMFLVFTLFRESLGPVHDVLRNALMPLFIPLQHMLIKLVIAMHPFLQQIGGRLQPLFLKLGNKIIPFVVKGMEILTKLLMGLADSFDKNGIKGVWDYIKASFKSGLDWVKSKVPFIIETIKSIFDGLKKAAEPYIPQIKKFFTEFLRGMITAGYDWLKTDGLGLLKKGFTWLKKEGEYWFKQALSWLSPETIAMLLNVKHKLSNLWTELKGFGGFLSSMGKTLLALSAALLGAKLLTGLMGLAKGIAAVGKMIGVGKVAGLLVPGAKTAGAISGKGLLAKGGGVNLAAKGGMGLLAKGGLIAGAGAAGYAGGTILNKTFDLDKKISKLLHGMKTVDYFDPRSGLTEEALAILDGKGVSGKGKASMPQKDKPEIAKKDFKDAVDMTGNNLLNLSEGLQLIADNTSTLVRISRDSIVNDGLSLGMA